VHLPLESDRCASRNSYFSAYGFSPRPPARQPRCLDQLALIPAAERVLLDEREQQLETPKRRPGRRQQAAAPAAPTFSGGVPSGRKATRRAAA